MKEESIPQKEEKEEATSTSNPLITTPIQFQFNFKVQHPQSKPKIEIKFKTDLNHLVNETSHDESSQDRNNQEEMISDFKPGQSVHIEYKTKQYTKEKKRKQPEDEVVKVEPPSLERVLLLIVFYSNRYRILLDGVNMVYLLVLYDTSLCYSYLDMSKTFSLRRRIIETY